MKSEYHAYGLITNWCWNGS